MESQEVVFSKNRFLPLVAAAVFLCLVVAGLLTGPLLFLLPAAVALIVLLTMAESETLVLDREERTVQRIRASIGRALSFSKKVYPISEMKVLSLQAASRTLGREGLRLVAELKDGTVAPLTNAYARKERPDLEKALQAIHALQP